MENQTDQNQNTGQNDNGQPENHISAQQEEHMKKLAAGVDMLQIQAARVPEMLQSASAAVVNGVKNMSTTRKVIGAGVLTLGTVLLLRNVLNKRNGSNTDDGSKTKKRKNQK